MIKLSCQCKFKALYHKRLAYLEGSRIVSLSDYAKSKKLSYPNLINKAKRQTIEAFLEKGEWKIAISETNKKHLLP